jgi:hypothetical protein
MDQQIPDKQEPIVEDLTVTEEEADGVKAGPVYLSVEGVTGDVSSLGHDRF